MTSCVLERVCIRRYCDAAVPRAEIHNIKCSFPRERTAYTPIGALLV